MENQNAVLSTRGVMCVSEKCEGGNWKTVAYSTITVIAKCV